MRPPVQRAQADVPFTSGAMREMLEANAALLLERHLSTAKEWFPHEMVPWELGRNFKPGEVCEPNSGLDEGVSSALFVNLLTEDNLPHYFHSVAEAFGAASALGEWSRRWAAEEQRHAIVLRDWISVTRQLDLVALERARMRQVSTGFSTGACGQGIVDGLVYLALQELATRISHWNTGRFLDDVGAAVMKRVAADENLHYLFYRDLASAALRADPSGTVVAIDRQVTAFQMPGSGMDGFATHAASIARAGIYDFRVHYQSIIAPVVLGHWGVESIEGLDAEAELAREHLMKWVGRLKRVADRIADQYAAVAAG